jgi:hypothetical protein
MNDAQTALKKIDLDWATHIEKIWETLNSDVSALQQDVRRAFHDNLEALQNNKAQHSPTGFVLVGQAGSGKTHFLRYVRQQCLSQNITFILVDMTGVNDFWETVLQGYLNSLQQSQPPDNISQAQQVISCLFHPLPLKALEDLEADKAAKFIRLRIEALQQKRPTERAKIQRFKDVYRAFVLLNTHAGENIGYNWLLGLSLEPDEKKDFGFARASMPPKDIVEGLSWLIGLCGACVLAFDQMDSLVSKQRILSPEPGALRTLEVSEEQRTAKAIIEDIAGGLMSLRDVTARTLSVVACLEPTWNIIDEYSVVSVQARFHSPKMLSPVLEPKHAEHLIAARFRESYASSGFVPEYPTWPLDQAFFEETGGGAHSPRKVLQRCHQRIQAFLESADAPQNTLDAAFETAKNSVDLAKLLNQYGEDEGLGSLLQTAAECLLIENPLPPEIDAELETQFQEVSKSPVLHGRLRLIFPDGQEKHLGFRAMQRENARAYQARLKAAVTASGIDRALTFRRLLLVRSPSRAIPSGQVTRQQMQKFEAAGGILARPENSELQVLGALQRLRDKPDFKAWLKQQRLVSKLPFLKDITAWLFGDLSSQSQPGSSQETQANSVPKEETEATPKKQSPLEKIPTSAKPETDKKMTAAIPLGVFVRNHKPTDDTVTLPLEQLTRHSVVLAGSGSGKTVLLKRLIEEAALHKIPAIVLDIGGDLVRLGEAWSQSPQGLFEHDKEKLARFHREVETLIWTPGKESGLPLTLNPLPDFAAVLDDPEEFESALDMARDSLEVLVITGKGKEVERAVLRNTLEYFARKGGDNLRDLADLLRDLAPDAWGDFGEQAHKLAHKMADLLSAALTNHALLRQRGAALDPAVLFGVGQAKTRLSVISLSGLSGQEAQQQFVNQLAMTLFTWVKKHPSSQLNGLFVLDEAKDFVPSQSNTPCKASLTRLAAQARKYGLGLVFASQTPKSIDHNIVANCSTQFYGKQNSPTAIKAAEEMLKQHGGNVSDLGALEKGRFYLVTENIKPAQKIATPLCFSSHEGALDENEILRRAAECRNKIAK